MIFIALDGEFLYCFLFFMQKTAYEMRISDWSSDVCSSDLLMFLLANLLRAGTNLALGSFETSVKPILQRKLRAAILREPETNLSADRIPDADKLIRERLSILAQNVRDEDDEMDLTTILERARIAVLRDGVRLLRSEEHTSELQ